jgi:hypothetical protein
MLSLIALLAVSQPADLDESLYYWQGRDTVVVEKQVAEPQMSGRIKRIIRDQKGNELIIRWVHRTGA